MSASTPSVGIDHPTVVPTNFDPESRDDGDDDNGDNDDDGSADASTDDRSDTSP